MRPLAIEIARIAVELHPDRIGALSSSLRRAETRDDIIAAVTQQLGNAAPRVQAFVKAVRSEPNVTPGEVAAMLDSAAATASAMRSGFSLELVWTGPDTTIVPARHTEQVLVNVIDEAVESLFIVSFVAYHVPNVLSALEHAAARGVTVKVLLEPSEDAGGKIAFDSTSAIRAVLPNGEFYVWNKKPESSGGCVHAKCVVADSKFAFITSANLTGAAMERNIEVGVLIRGGILPAQLDEQLNALIETKHLRLV